MTLGSSLSDILHRFQGDLFPALAEAVGPLLETHSCFVTALDPVKVECFVGEVWTVQGRPREDRWALARGFIAKAVSDPTTTRHLIDRLKVDPTLRRLCGWSRVLGLDGHRGPGDAGPEAEGQDAEPQARPAPQGRGEDEGAWASRTASERDGSR